MKKLESFLNVVEIFVDEEKTIYKFTNYTLWRWLTRLSMILIITPLFPIPIILYILFLYAIAKPNKDISQAYKNKLKLEVFGSKSMLENNYQVTIYRENSEKIIAEIKVFVFLKKFLKFLGILSLIILGLIIIWILIFYIFIKPYRDDVGEYNYLCSYVINDEANQKLLEINDKLDSRTVFACDKYSFEENNAIYQISTETKLDFISMANIYALEGKDSLYEKVESLPLEDSRKELALRLIQDLE